MKKISDLKIDFFVQLGIVISIVIFVLIYFLSEDRVILYRFGALFIIALLGVFMQIDYKIFLLNTEIRKSIESEREVSEMTRQLELRVAERTRELFFKNNQLNETLAELKEAQDQLVTQEKMASVGMLTTGIAHEIKNPLNFVNNFSDVAVTLLDDLHEELNSTKNVLDDEKINSIEQIIGDLKVSCEKIKHHGESADNIVKMMLMYSQESSAQKEMFSIVSLIDRCIDITLATFKATYQKFDVEVEKHYNPEINEVLIAPQTLSKAFCYLFDNAFYAINEKRKREANYKPNLGVFIEKADSNLIIKIRDNGIGISKKIIDKVFEPFFTTKPTGKGNTGLGLSFCYTTVVKQHNGELRVQSEEGVYTEVSVVLNVHIE